MQPLRPKKSRNLLGQKITQPLGTKKITQPLGTKKSHNLWGQKKIIQPLRIKKNHATSRDITMRKKIKQGKNTDQLGHG